VTDVHDHFSRFMDLLDVEREAEKEENKRQLDRWPIEIREQQGKTIRRLTIDKLDAGLGGLPLLSVSRQPLPNEELASFHNMDAGDLVRVVFADRQAMEGTLYEVDDHRAVVALNQPMVEAPVGKCEIDLLGSDATYKRMRRALSIARDASGRLAELRDVLLGLSEATVGRLPKDLSFHNQGLNEWQRQAVETALAADDVALVHGPPGTGKTTVLVEIIRQAVDRGQKVLASAPSNIAVDNMLEKLLDAGLNVVRLGHPARTMEELRHASLISRLEEDPEFSVVQERDIERERLSLKLFRAQQYGGMNIDDQKALRKEVRHLWKEAREIEREIGRRIIQASDVVLATHGGLGRNVTNMTFDLAVLDEASQATEPLSWISLVHARKVVLAGDPLQLPPTIYSKEAAQQGLALTLMERLMPDLPDGTKTLLRVQYRMHEDIMRFSSERFYEGRLIAHDSVARHTANELPEVVTTPLTQRPLTFVDTAGTGFVEVWNELLDSRENEGEARVALKIWEELSAAGIRPRQAALITPYNAQAKLLRSMGPRGLEISSVDGFQGREKEVILVSLVRSNEKGEVGFLSDTRRMNVALTRARRLLVVIGDSATLGRHPFYTAFLDYVASRGEHTSAWEWLRS
jgi:ATP-dependent RNA/DNA helicase IGHMBP2